MVMNPAEASHMLVIVKIKAKEYGKGLVLFSIGATVPNFFFSFFFFFFFLNTMFCAILH